MGGGVTSFRVICRSGQLKNTPILWEYFLEHFLPPQGWFLAFFPVFFALFRRRCLSCLTFSSVALAGQKACQFYIILLCFRPCRTWAHKGCRGMQGMPGMQGMSLVLEVFVGVGDAGDVAGKILPCFGSFSGGRFCLRAACGGFRWLEGTAREKLLLTESAS